jgi:hypothetical protein
MEKSLDGDFNIGKVIYAVGVRCKGGLVAVKIIMDGFLIDGLNPIFAVGLCLIHGFISPF